MRTIVLFCVTYLLVIANFSKVHAQPLLRTEHAKMCTYSNGVWSSWSDEWTPLTARFRFTQIDIFALEFRVELTLAGFPVNSRFTYVGYDSENNWFKYKEVDGSDVVCVEGVKMSYLASTGWPSYDVKIYIWSRRNGVGMVFD